MSVYNPGVPEPFDKIGWKFDEWHDGLHKGVDWWASKGTPIPAAAAGIVVGLGEDPEYGNLVIIRHTMDDEPPYRYTLYAHMEPTLPVSRGSEVSRGQTIGYVDSTGSRGGREPHLHFELISLSEEDGTWEKQWGGWDLTDDKVEDYWKTGRALKFGGGYGRIDPLNHANWDGIDVYVRPWRRGGR